jgi:hypothetical protein
MDRKKYEEDLKERQEKHLRQVRKNKDLGWKPCAYDSCQ